MSLTRNELEDWASAYIDAQQLPTSAKLDSPLWWSIERFQILHDPQKAEEAWAAILAILARKPPTQVIGMLAAGPLEQLIEDCGARFIERIECEARDNTDFRHLLGGVWRSNTSEIWERIEKARGASWM